eukprot:115511_1
MHSSSWTLDEDCVDEFEDKGDTNDLWGDAEELDIVSNCNNTETAKQSSNVSVSKTMNNKQHDATAIQEEKCWTCSQCEHINNLKWTLDIQNMRCAACRTEYSVQTPIISSSEWTNPHFLATRSWICPHCTFHNTIHDNDEPNSVTSVCTICQRENTNDAVEITISVTPWHCPSCYCENVDNYTVKCDFCGQLWYESPADDTHESDSYELEDDPDDCAETEEEEDENRVHRRRWRSALSNTQWKCSNCKAQTYGLNCCSTCFCHKPGAFERWNAPIEYLVFGYCRVLMVLPFVIIKMIQKYCPNSVYGSFKCDSKVPKYTLRGALVAKNRDSIYRWTFKLKCNDSYCFVDANNKCSDVFLWGVRIGIQSVSVENDYRITYGLAHQVQFPNITQSNSRYCKPFTSGDVITMELNMEEGSLCYAINDEWYGTFCCVYPDHYTSYIAVHNEGVTIDSISFIEKNGDCKTVGAPEQTLNKSVA